MAAAGLLAGAGAGREWGWAGYGAGLGVKLTVWGNKVNTRSFNLFLSSGFRV